MVLVVPLAPARGGNGLAMRAGMLLESLAAGADVELVVCPVAGPAAELAWPTSLARSVVVIPPVGGPDWRRHVTAQLADERLRRRLEQTAPLPARVAAAPPTLADEALPSMRPTAGRPRAVVALRGYLAPFACTLARRLHSERTVVDLDDDDAALARAMGDHQEADAITRLAKAWLPDVDVVCVAGDDEARSMANRYGLQAVEVIPNAVRRPARTTPPPGHKRLLFVGNLTYAPNIEAARVLVDEILPIVRERHPQATVALVGAHAGDLREVPGVQLAGAVSDLEPWYSATDVVIVPMRHGAGTRIKVIEAFAYRRPVVATPVAVAGLAVQDDRDVLLAESPNGLAKRVGDLFEDSALAARLTDHAARTLEDHYVPSVVAPAIRRAVLGDPD